MTEKGQMQNAKFRWLAESWGDFSMFESDLEREFTIENSREQIPAVFSNAFRTVYNQKWAPKPSAR